MPFGPSEAGIFVLELSAKLEDSLRLEATEKMLRSGGKLTSHEERFYRALKARAPADYRQIKIVRSSRALPWKQAREITDLWRDALLDVRYPQKASFVLHGETYRFSGEFPSFRGMLSGHVMMPEPETRTARLVALVETMADYTRGKVELETLGERIEAARKP